MERFFFTIIQDINKVDSNLDEISRKTKAWVNDFTSTYQAKDVTPYIHSFTRVLETIWQYYNQQGLEKLNNLTTKQFQRLANHHDIQALLQILQKRNRIELLKDQGFQRIKSEQKCCICKKRGHNKRTCMHS